MWETATGDIAWYEPISSIHRIEFSADGAHFVALQLNKGDATSSALIFDTATKRQIRSVENIRPTFSLLRPGDDLVILRPDGTLERQHLISGQVVSSALLDSGMYALPAVSHAPLVAILDYSGTIITLWNIDNGTRVQRHVHSTGERFREIAISPTGEILAAVGSDHLLHVLDIPSLHARVPLRGHGDEIHSVRFSPANSMILTAGNDHTARLWKSAPFSDSQISGEPTGRIVASASQHPFVLLQHADGTVECWDDAMKKSARTPGDFVRAAGEFFADEAGFFTTRRESPEAVVIERWSIAGKLLGSARRTTPSTHDTLHRVAFSPSTNRVAFFNGDKTISLQPLDGDAPPTEIELGSPYLDHFKFSPDGSFLSGLNWPNRGLLWNVADGTLRGRRPLSKGTVNGMAISRDSKLLATAGDDNLITIQNLATGETIAVLRGHKAAVRALAFSTDGRTLASASADLTLRLWHIATWRELGVIGRNTAFSSLAFCGTPAKLVAIGPKGRVVFEGRGE